MRRRGDLADLMTAEAVVSPVPKRQRDGSSLFPRTLVRTGRDQQVPGLRIVATPVRAPTLGGNRRHQYADQPQLGWVSHGTGRRRFRA